MRIEDIKVLLPSLYIPLFLPDPPTRWSCVVAGVTYRVGGIGRGGAESTIIGGDWVVALMGLDATGWCALGYADDRVDWSRVWVRGDGYRSVVGDLV